MQKKRIGVYFNEDDMKTILRGKAEYITENMKDIPMNEFIREMVIRGITHK